MLKPKEKKKKKVSGNWQRDYLKKRKTKGAMLQAALLPRKKKQKEGQRCYPGKREERKKKMQLENIGIFVNKKNSSDSVFSPFWGETF